MVNILKTLLRVALVLFVTSAGVRAQAPEVPSRREVLAAIATLEDRFLSPEAVRAGGVVTRFVVLSEDCLIVLDPEAIPWAEDSELASADDRGTMLRSLLLAAEVQLRVAVGLRGHLASNMHAPSISTLLMHVVAVVLER